MVAKKKFIMESKPVLDRTGKFIDYSIVSIIYERLPQRKDFSFHSYVFEFRERVVRADFYGRRVSNSD